MCELKPCPFCGKNELRQLGVLKKVQCINESCDHAFKNPMLPIAWQTRPIEDALRAENERLREAYIDDCQSKPCYANKKEEARKKINDILAHALTERKEDYYLDGKYFRWGKLEKDIMEVVDNIFVDGGNENAK